MNEIQLIVNGKEVQLTEEQIKAINFTLKGTHQNPFERVNSEYYFINETGKVDSCVDDRDSFDDSLYVESNYFNDEQFANQIALHQLLYRKLLKFSYENTCTDVEWNGTNDHWCIYYDPDDIKYCVAGFGSHKFDGVWFSSEEGAERAIKEVVEPFMKEHPEFVW